MNDSVKRTGKIIMRNSFSRKSKVKFIDNNGLKTANRISTAQSRLAQASRHLSSGYRMKEVAQSRCKVRELHYNADFHPYRAATRWIQMENRSRSRSQAFGGGFFCRFKIVSKMMRETPIE